MDGVAARLTRPHRRPRRWSRLGPLGRPVVCAVLACALLSCATDPAPDRSTPGSPSASAAPTAGDSAAGRAGSAPSATASRETPERLPAVPPADPSELARQLDRMAAILRDPEAAADAVRRAGRFQQLAARAVAARADAFRRKLMSRLRPGAARIVRGDVRAALRLHALTDPQDSLPRWRIVAPPAPEKLLDHYRRAERRTGVPWTYLAAIHLVETRMGRIRGVSSAGARGPMQFLPATWDIYGAGGDINDPKDAILAAARLLKANGAPGDMAEALWHYNPSDDYVAAVGRYARTMQRWPATYRGYWHWRVLYRHQDGVYVLPIGYPEERAVPLPARR